MNSAGAYFVVNGKRIELSYNNANLPYVCATTAGNEAEHANIQANACGSEDNSNLTRSGKLLLNIQANVCGSEDNSNLTRSGKLLLLWHQRLGHASFKLV